MNTTTNMIQPKRKAELQELLKGYNYKLVRKEIISVVMDLRKVPLKEAQNIKTITPPEVKEILKRFDYELTA